MGVAIPARGLRTHRARNAERDDLITAGDPAAAAKEL